MAWMKAWRGRSTGIETFLPSDACRACGHSKLAPVLDLGLMPLANALLPAVSSEPEPNFPLELVYCPNCSLTQITETVPPEKMFSHYTYFSSYSETMLDHAREMTEWLVGAKTLSAASLVMEIASNDGYLLQYFVRKNIPVLGIEPAENVARVAQADRGVPTICEFFEKSLAVRLRKENRLADVVIANNVLAHVPDLSGFLEGVRTVLKPDGIAVIEVPYVMDLLARCEFDTIYHEHLSYFSVTALTRLFRKHDMTITDIERIPIHGGSLRIVAGAGLGSEGERVQRLLAAESAQSMPPVFAEFRDRSQAVKAGIREFLREKISAGKKVAAYGAAAKGCVFLNYCGLGIDQVAYVVDRNPAKQGKRMPGTHQPIFAPSKLLEEPPDYLLILPWNISDEIVKQESAYRGRGGRFVVAVPEVREIY